MYADHFSRGAVHVQSFTQGIPTEFTYRLCCPLTQLPGMKAFHLLTILSRGDLQSSALSQFKCQWAASRSVQVYTLHLGALRSVLNDQACSQPLGL